MKAIELAQSNCGNCNDSLEHRYIPSHEEERSESRIASKIEASASVPFPPSPEALGTLAEVSCFRTAVESPGRNHDNSEKRQTQSICTICEHCLAMAEIATAQNSRIIQREMAAEWLILADDVRLQPYP